MFEVDGWEHEKNTWTFVQLGVLNKASPHPGVAS